MFYKFDITILAPPLCKSSNLAILAVAILVALTSFFTPIFPYKHSTMLNNFTDFPELTIASVNCNSLNMSVSSKHNQCKKIYGITKLQTDIILLSDIRLCNKNLVSASNDCAKVFCTNPYRAYNFIFNSSRSNMISVCRLGIP